LRYRRLQLRELTLCLVELMVQFRASPPTRPPL
jgi:hypothetical protein